MKKIELEQDTPEWHEFRRSHLGASEAACVMELCPYKKPHDLWGEKVGFVKPFYMNGAMQRGKDLEEEARKKFCKQMEVEFVPAVFSCTIEPYTFMSASLDGISSDNEILEIKCNGKKWHAMVENGEVPPHHIAQLQHQLFVCEAEKAYYFSYDGKEGITLEVQRDEKYIKNLLYSEKIFWDKVEGYDFNF